MYYLIHLKKREGNILYSMGVFLLPVHSSIYLVKSGAVIQNVAHLSLYNMPAS